MLDWLYGLQGIGVKLGLENTRRLLATLPQPPSPPRLIHVAGTNGKGSVCAFLDALTRAHGLRTGLFTSPHLIRYHERIRIDGEPISDTSLNRWLGQIKATVADWDPHPSFFEITLALGMAAFHEAEVEIIILETGLGGRLDASNAIAEKDLTVITPIHLDHTQILGDTLAAIAKEKAGIFRSGTPIVSAAQAPEAEVALRQAAATLAAPIHFVDHVYDAPLGLPGAHQRENAALAHAAFQMLGIPLDTDTAADALAATQWPGRFQTLHDDAGTLIIDGAHNPASIAALVSTWRETFGSQKATILFGCAQEKAIAESLALLEPIAARFVFLPIHSPRSESPDTLASQTTAPSQIAQSFEEALRKALDYPEPRLVTGSLFLVGEALASCEGQHRPRRTAQ